MTPSRWQQIEKLYHAALEMSPSAREALLAGADAEIRREVESLLAQGATEFVPGNPIPASTVTQVALGSQLGPYKLDAPIGAGGMGQVFRATDTRLRRTVAIKILPSDKVADPDRKRRFLQEARAASALNHPNIVTLHDIANDHGIDYLVMEHVAGKSLDKLITSKGLPVSEAIGYIQQIASALAAAHAAGIVHRDVKPANVIITADSQVKVLDFGLAKLMERASGSDSQTETAESALTETGTVMGTVAYMSPEQASGKQLDHRTDIFSLGVVLYEMITGHRPFHGKSTVDTLHAIINGPVEPLAHQPSEFQDIVDRALAKDPKERYQHAGDLALDLRRFQHRPIGADRATSNSSWRWRGAAIAFVFAMAAAVTAWFMRGTAARPDNPLADATFTRLTDFPGSELDAAISPDGKFVAFLSDRDGPFDLFLGQVGTGRFENRTNGKEGELLEPTRSIGFTADGSGVWLKGRKFDEDGGPPRIMPLLGGAPRPFMETSAVPVMVAWSPDGTRIAYHLSQGDPIFVADRMGGNPKQIFVNSNTEWHSHFLAWSQDAQWIYFVKGNPANTELDVWRISPSGGEPERITQHNADVAYPTPINSRTVLYVAPAEDGSGPWLWAVDVETKLSRRVSFGLEQYRSLYASADGRRVVATVSNPSASLWQVPILDRVVEEKEVQRYPVPTVRSLAPRIAGDSLFYLSSLGRGDGLWRFKDGQALEIWSGAESALMEASGVSRDGQQVTIRRRRPGHSQIYMMNADGSGMKSLADTIDARNSSCFSPDGKWVLSGGNDASGPGLFKIPVDGGPPVRLLKKTAFDPVWSADGSLILYSGPVVGRFRTIFAILPDGTPVDIPQALVTRDGGGNYRLMPDGKAFVYTKGGLRHFDFWMVDLVTKKSRQLTRLSDSAGIRSFDITPDGKRIVFDRLRENSDIVLIELPK